MCRSIIYHLYHLYSYINIVLNKYYIPHNLCLHQKGIHDQKRQWWIAYKISLCNGICKEPYVFFLVFFSGGGSQWFWKKLFFSATVFHSSSCDKLLVWRVDCLTKSNCTWFVRPCAEHEMEPLCCKNILLDHLTKMYTDFMIGNKVWSYFFSGCFFVYKFQPYVTDNKVGKPNKKKHHFGHDSSFCWMARAEDL